MGILTILLGSATTFTETVSFVVKFLIVCNSNTGPDGSLVVFCSSLNTMLKSCRCRMYFV
jgi:hypothetical protein